jgi:hypothetical protein
MASYKSRGRTRLSVYVSRLNQVQICKAVAFLSNRLDKRDAFKLITEFTGRLPTPKRKKGEPERRCSLANKIRGVGYLLDNLAMFPSSVPRMNSKSRFLTTALPAFGVGPVCPLGPFGPVAPFAPG